MQYSKSKYHSFVLFACIAIANAMVWSSSCYNLQSFTIASFCCSIVSIILLTDECFGLHSKHSGATDSFGPIPMYAPFAPIQFAGFLRAYTRLRLELSVHSDALANTVATATTTIANTASASSWLDHSKHQNPLCDLRLVTSISTVVFVCFEVNVSSSCFKPKSYVNHCCQVCLFSFMPFGRS